MSHEHENEGHQHLEDDSRIPNEYELLEQAIRELLIEKGVFSADDLRRTIDQR